LTKAWAYQYVLVSLNRKQLHLLNFAHLTTISEKQTNKKKIQMRVTTSNYLVWIIKHSFNLTKAWAYQYVLVSLNRKQLHLLNFAHLTTISEKQTNKQKNTDASDYFKLLGLHLAMFLNPFGIYSLTILSSPLMSFTRITKQPEHMMPDSTVKWITNRNTQRPQLNQRAF
jgi:hypothetical protein